MKKFFAIPILLLALSIYYCWPLLDYSHVHAGNYETDVIAQIPVHALYCDSFYFTNYHSDAYFWPEGVDLRLTHDMAPLTAISCLLKPLGPIAMFHFVIWLQILLIFFSYFLLAQKFIKDPWLQIGFVIAASYSSFFQGVSAGTFTLYSLCWSGALVLYLFWDCDLTKIKKEYWKYLLLGLILAANWQASAHLFFLIVFLAARAIFPLRHRPKQALLNSAIAMGLCLIAMAPFFYPIADAYLKVGKNLVPEGTQIYNTDLLGLLMPHPASFFYSLWNYLVPDSSLINKFTSQIFISINWILLPPFLWALFKKASWRSYFFRSLMILSLIYLVFSFGPILAINNEKYLNLSYFDILRKWPPFFLSRTPARYGQMSLMLFTLLSFWSLESYLWLKLKQKWRWPVGIALIGLCAWSVGLFSYDQQIHTTRYTDYIPLEGLNKMAQDGNPNALVLNIPVEMSDQSQTFLQMFHHKKVLNAYMSYTLMTEKTLRFLMNSQPPLLNINCVSMNLMMQNRNYETDRENFYSSLKKVGVKYIILNKTYLNCSDLKIYLTGQLLLQPFVRILDQNTDYLIMEVL